VDARTTRPVSSARVRRRQWSLNVGADPRRLPTVVTDLVVAGLAVLVIIGLIDFAITRQPGPIVQVVASAALVAWAAVMKRRGRPRPALLLGMAVILAFAYLVLAGLGSTFADITDTSPIAIIVGAGVVAVAAGGRDSIVVGIGSLVIATVATVVVQTSLGSELVDIFVDSANSLVVMAVAFAVVLAVRNAAEDGFTRYRGLVESAPVAVVEVDLAAYLAREPRVHLGPMNAVASSVLGYVDGRTEANIPLGAIPQEFVDILDLAATAPSGSRVRKFSDGRTFKVGWQVDPVTGSVTLTGTDITAQRMAEDELSGQLSARDRFIATVSHELRTPLTGAMGMLELVRSGDFAEGPERDEMIDLALLQVRDMADIVEDLLVAARAASGRLSVHPQTVDVSAAVQAVLSVIGEPFDQAIEPGARAWVDPVRVRQIVKNLMTNAVRYGGTARGVAVRTERNRVVVEVSDDGPPLAADFRARMFEPYERLGGRAPTESVGLGLTVARTLARLMDGDVTYDHDGRARFRLVLPLAKESQVAPN